MDRQILKRILFTSVGRRVELMQSFQRASVKAGIPIWIVGADLTDTAPALYYCDEAVRVPRITDESYIPALLQICREKNIELLIPTIDTDLLKLSQAKKEFESQGTRVFIGDVDKVSLCRDKRLTGNFFSSLGLLSPVTVDRVEDYTGDYPCFIKPLNGSSSINAYRADDEDALKTYAAEIGEGNYIIQTYITGTEYTIDIFSDFDGRPVFVTPRIRNAVRSGEVLKTTICQDERLILEGRKIGEAFHAPGMICAQLIRDNTTGLDYFIEINPRFGGGAPLSIAAGADAPGAVLRMLMGEKPEYTPEAAEDGLVFSRFDQRVCVNKREAETVRVNTGSAVSSHVKRLVDNGTLQAVVFDLDDTLYPEHEYVENGFREVSKLYKDSDQVFKFLMHEFDADVTLGAPIDNTVKHFGGDDEFKKKCVAAYRNQKPEHLTIYPWALELIKFLKSRNIPMGIITDGRMEGQRAKLSATGVTKFIDEGLVIITDELGGAQFRKPCDIAYRIMQMRLNVPSDRIIYIGNNPTKDFKGARAIGMRTLFFDNPECIHVW